MNTVQSCGGIQSVEHGLKIFFFCLPNLQFCGTVLVVHVQQHHALPHQVGVEPVKLTTSYLEATLLLIHEISYGMGIYKLYSFLQFLA